MIKTRPSKSKTTSQLIKELDEVFSEFVRLRDCDDQGTITCFITGERVWWRDADAAHFHNRQHMGTRWNELNVHATTIDSNRFDPYHLNKYISRMRHEYGKLVLDSLEAARRNMYKFTSVELQEKIDHYKEEVKKLRASKKI